MVRIMDILKDSRKEKIFESSIFILVGLVCAGLALVDTVCLCYTLASICILTGVFYLFGFFLMLKEHNKEILSRAIILLLLGLIIALFQEQFLMIFPLVIAIFLIYNAINHLMFTFDIKAINEHHWKVDLVFSLILLLLGIGFVVINAIDGIKFEYVLIAGGSVNVIQGIIKIILLGKIHSSYNKRDE
jgi:uncharacterized membrane protein HdeD (DUF308 family)